MTRRPASRNRQRPQGTRNYKHILFVFCEGACEVTYLKGLKNFFKVNTELTRIEFIDLGEQGDAEKMLTKARETTKKQTKEWEPLRKNQVQVWLVYDCEPHDKARYEIAKSVYAKLGGHLPEKISQAECAVVSWPSFDVWLLFHSDCSLKQIDTPQKAKAQVEKIFSCSLPRLDFATFENNLSEAEKKAKVYWNNLAERETFPTSVASSLFRLVDHIRALSQPI